MTPFGDDGDGDADDGEATAAAARTPAGRTSWVGLPAPPPPLQPHERGVLRRMARLAYRLADRSGPGERPGTNPLRLAARILRRQALFAKELVGSSAWLFVPLGLVAALLVAILAGSGAYLGYAEQREAAIAAGLADSGDRVEGTIVRADDASYEVRYEIDGVERTAEVVQGFHARPDRPASVTVLVDQIDRGSVAVGGDTTYASGPRAFVARVANPVAAGLLVACVMAVFYALAVLAWAALATTWSAWRRSGRG
jgi:hypothetical protein